MATRLGRFSDALLYRYNAVAKAFHFSLTDNKVQPKKTSETKPLGSHLCWFSVIGAFFFFFWRLYRNSYLSSDGCKRDAHKGLQWNLRLYCIYANIRIVVPHLISGAFEEPVSSLLPVHVSDFIFHSNNMFSDDKL